MNLIASFNQMMRAFGSVEQVDARLIFPPYGISPQSHPSSFPSPGNCNGNATPDVPLLQNMMDVVDGGAMTAPLMVPAGSNGTEASLLSGSDMGMQGGGGFQMTMINGGGGSNNSPADGSGCSGSGGDYGGLSAQDQLNIAPDNGGQDAEADARDAGDDADTSNGGESADDTDDLIVPAADEHGQLIAVQRKKHQPKGNVRRTKGHQVFPAWSAAPRVLVVEDNIVSRKLSARILQLIGCNIETAVNGQEAVAKMGSGKYDLCLMDINMPSLSG
jgi:CheY-like chemotaxis protein